MKSGGRLRWSFQILLAAQVIGLIIADAIDTNSSDLPKVKRLRTSRKLKRESGDCVEPGYYGSDNDCRNFYRCVEEETNSADGYSSSNFKKYYFECGPGTIFDPAISQCNWPDNVNPKPACYKDANSSPPCDKDNATTGHQPEQGEQAPTSPAHEGGHQPGSGNNQPSQPGSGGNNQQRPPHSGSGGNNQQRPPGSGGSDNAPPSNQEMPSEQQCQSEGFFGSQSNCRGFYRCVSQEDGSYTVFNFECPDGTVFDEDIGNCNHAWAVDPTSKCYQPGAQAPDSEDNELGETSNQQGSGGSQGSPGSGWTPPESSGSGSQQGPGDSQQGPGDSQQGPGDSQQGPGDSQQGSGGSNSPSNGPDCNNQTSTGGNGGQQNEPGSDSGCSSEGFFPNPQDCKKFIRCVDNGVGGLQQYDFDCGPGTVYDTDLPPGTCNHPQALNKNNKCYKGNQAGDSSSSQQMTQRPPAPQSTQKPKPTSTQKPKPTSTQRPKPTSTQRPKPTSQSTQKPPAPESTEGPTSTTPKPAGPDCNKNQTQATSEGGSGGSGVGNNECESEGFHPNPEDCKKFFRCVDFGQGAKLTKFDFDCGPGTVYDPDLITCNHAWAVDRNSKCYKPMGSAPPGEDQSSSGGDDGSGCQQQSSGNCNNKPESQQGESSPAPQPNPSGPPPDESKPQEEPPQESEQPESQNQTSSEKPPSSSQICSNEGFYPNEEDCTRFYRCVDFDGSFTKFDFQCGPGTMWHPKEETCVHPWQMDKSSKCFQGSGGNNGSDGGENENEQQKPCNNGTSPVDSTTSSPTTTSEATTTTEQTTTTIAATTIAATTEQTTTTAPASTTAQQSETTEQPSDSGSEDCGKIECKQAGFYGHPTDCTKFYRCVDFEQTGKDFTIFHFDCAEGTIFDESISVCNHPHAVQPPPKCMTGCKNNNSTNSTTSKPCQQTTPAPEQSEGETTMTESTTTADTTTAESTTAAMSTTEASSTPQNESTTAAMSTTEASTTPQNQEDEGTTEAPMTTQQPTTSAPTMTTAESIMMSTTTCPSYVSETTGASMTMTPMPANEEPTTYRPTTMEDTTTTTTTTTTTSTTTTTEATTTTAEPTTTTEAATTTEPPEIPEFLINCRSGPGQPKIRAHPVDCTKFYTCNWVGGSFVIKVNKCPQDKVFVQDKQDCIEKDKAPPCKNETITTTEESEVARCEQIIEAKRRNKPFILDPVPRPEASIRMPGNFANFSQTKMMNEDGTCPDEGVFGIREDEGCTRFYKCVRNINRFLMSLLMKCPPKYQFYLGKCMKNTTLDKIGFKCTSGRYRAELEDYNSNPGLPAIYLNPELVEGIGDQDQDQLINRYGASSSDSLTKSISLLF